MIDKIAAIIKNEISEEINLIIEDELSKASVRIKERIFGQNNLEETQIPIPSTEEINQISLNNQPETPGIETPPPNQTDEDVTFDFVDENETENQPVHQEPKEMSPEQINEVINNMTQSIVDEINQYSEHGYEPHEVAAATEIELPVILEVLKRTKAMKETQGKQQNA